MTFPKLSTRDKLRLFGWANFMGHIFIFDPKKFKAIMIINGQVYYVQKENGKLFGVNRDTKEKMDFEMPMNISYVLKKVGIFPVTNEDVNAFGLPNKPKTMKEYES